ncbi:MAG TPA: type II toxin-antitoxin system VapC family toxin, partial [Caulobacteraceae bacterium]
MIYLDTSVVLPLFFTDAHAPRVRAWLSRVTAPSVISPWTVAEFSSAAAGHARMGRLADGDWVRAEAAFDIWAAGLQKAPVLTADFDMARNLIRRDRTRLRTPDALHLAIARRLDIALATLDGALAEAARQVGVLV